MLRRIDHDQHDGVRQGPLGRRDHERRVITRIERRLARLDVLQPASDGLEHPPKRARHHGCPLPEEHAFLFEHERKNRLIPIEGAGDRGPARARGCIAEVVIQHDHVGIEIGMTINHRRIVGCGRAHVGRVDHRRAPLRLHGQFPLERVRDRVVGTGAIAVGARAAEQQDARIAGHALLHDGAAIAPDVEAADHLHPLVRVDVRGEQQQARQHDALNSKDDLDHRTTIVMKGSRSASGISAMRVEPDSSSCVRFGSSMLSSTTLPGGIVRISAVATMNTVSAIKP